MSIQILITVASRRYDQLLPLKTSSNRGDIAEFKEKLTGLANRTEELFCMSTSVGDAQASYNDAREALEEVDVLLQQRLISPEAAKFLKEDVFEPLVKRFGRLVSG